MTDLKKTVSKEEIFRRRLQRERLSWITVIIILIVINMIMKNTGFLGGEGQRVVPATITRVMQIVTKNFVSEVDIPHMVDGALTGMIESLGDVHSRYMPPEEFNNLQEETAGAFFGIGIYIGIRDDALTVIAPIESTPAWEADLRAGDHIIKIGTNSTLNMQLSEAVHQIKGPKGTPVILTIARKGINKPLEKTIVRDEITITSVESTFIKKKNIGYIRVKHFSDNTGKALEEALRTFDTRRPQISGLIIDLRFNPGGLLQQAVYVSDLILTNGVIVSTKGRIPRMKSSFSALPYAYCKDIPVVVLVNEGSASASEIVTGALRDNHRALIIGQKTFGKGSVQSVIPIRSLGRRTAIALTTAHYYTPSGECIHKKGIYPHIIVTNLELNPANSAVMEKVLDTELIDSMIGKTKPSTATVRRVYQAIRNQGINIDWALFRRLVTLSVMRDTTSLVLDMDYDLQLKRAVREISSGNAAFPIDPSRYPDYTALFEQTTNTAAVQ